MHYPILLNVNAFEIFYEINDILEDNKLLKVYQEIGNEKYIWKNYFHIKL